HADDDGEAARSDRVEDLERRGFAADGVERVVGAAAARELPHALGHVALLGVPRVGGAELAGEGELVLEQVARDDRPRPGQARAIRLMSCPLRRRRCVPSSMTKRAEAYPSQRMERPLEQ